MSTHSLADQIITQVNGSNTPLQPTVPEAADESLDDIFSSGDETPQPDVNGEFASPAEGAKFMAATYKIPQIPLRGKAPWFQDWPEKATLDLNQIDAWYAEHACNFGSVAKAQPGGQFVIEVDSVDVTKRMKNDGISFTSEVIVESRPGRGHRWYLQSDESIALGNLKQDYSTQGDFSVRVRNEQCVSPGSIHPVTGRQYRLKKRGELKTASQAELHWIKNQKAPAVTEKQNIKTPSGLVPHGQIHPWMVTALGKMRHAGLNDEELETTLLRQVHEYCQPPIDEAKVRQAARSAAKNWKEGNPGEGTIIFPQCKTFAAVGTPSEPMQQETIPAFDPSVITGIYKEIVDLVCDGTTIPRQFVYLAAKVYIGARMAGHVSFEGLDCDSRYYGTVVGETGTGKGLSWRRFMNTVVLLQGRDDDEARMLASAAPPVDPMVKIINSADSGAGLKDAFFEQPEHYPIIIYIDEVASLGLKNNEKKQPEVVAVIGELADSTTVSRVLAKTKGQKATRTTTARLSMYCCGQDRDTYISSFPGRGKLGFFDRCYPEHSELVEAGDLPDIDMAAAVTLRDKIEKLQFFGKMTMAPGVKQEFDVFWNRQSVETRKKVRFKKHILLDMFMSAFGRGVRVAESSDLEAAINIFNRQIVIRRLIFTFEAPDRVGFYVGLLKRATQTMRDALNSGQPIGNVAMSKRDFQTQTNAYRENELQVFGYAWRAFADDHLKTVEVIANNGQKYLKFIPYAYEDEVWA